jgi:hypothetical protein
LSLRLYKKSSLDCLVNSLRSSIQCRSALDRCFELHSFAGHIQERFAGQIQERFTCSTQSGAYSLVPAWMLGSSTLDKANSALLAANIEFSEKSCCWAVFRLQNLQYRCCIPDRDIYFLNVEYSIMQGHRIGFKSSPTTQKRHRSVTLKSAAHWHHRPDFSAHHPSHESHSNSEPSAAALVA